MKSCETHTGIEKGLLQNGEVLQQPHLYYPSLPTRHAVTDLLSSASEFSEARQRPQQSGKLSLPPTLSPNHSLGFYNKSCPRATRLLKQVVVRKHAFLGAERACERSDPRARQHPSSSLQAHHETFNCKLILLYFATCK